MSQSRQPELQKKVFADPDGKKYEGKRYIINPTSDSNYSTGYINCEVNYHNGKIHGSPAITFPDGLEEEWNNGKFVKILSLPYSNR